MASYIWLISKLRSSLTKEHRLIFYNAYIKPHFNYCCIVWSNYASYYVNLINKLQRRTCKLILLQEYSSLQKSLRELDILSFDIIVFLSKRMYKVYNNIAPSYLQEFVQMRYLNNDNATSVAHTNYVLPQAKCSLFKGILY